MAKRVVMFLIEGFEEVEAVTPLDYLRRAGVDVVSLGVKGLVVRGSHGIAVQADMLLDDWVGVPDGVIIPGGPGASRLVDNPKVVELITKVSQAGGIIGAICAAPVVVLNRMGLLAGRRFTCFMGMEAEVTNAQFIAQAVVEDGTIITSRSAGTANEFSEALVHALAGPRAARELSEKTWQYWIRDL